MPRPDPPQILTADDLDRLWANAADPADYPALRRHGVSQDGEAAQLPDEVVELAREVAGTLSLAPPRPRRRGGRRNRGKPRGGSGEQRHRAAELADPAEAITRLMDLLEVPQELYELNPNTVRFAVDDDEAAGYPPLPEGYGFKGGIARKALARTLRLPISTAAVRDIDLLRGLDTDGDHDRQLSERYMTEDMILGNAKVEAIVSLRDYFSTREVTMNELYYLDGHIEITPLGLADTLGGVIRVTRGHHAINRGQVHPIVAFKALRFAANMRAEGREPIIAPFRINYRKRPHPFEFFFALQLSRAFESGAEVAEQYLMLTREWGLLERMDLPELVTAAEAGGVLKERLADYHLTFGDAETEAEAELKNTA